VKRILAEWRELQSEPSPDFTIAPLEDNIFEWHFSLRGPSGTDFEGGLYHGRLILPSEYPMKPPSFLFLTPSGRFEVNTKICLSISNYHPEQWHPGWGIRTAMVALGSMFPEESPGSIGSLQVSPEIRRRYARDSIRYVCPQCGCKHEVVAAQFAQGASSSSSSSAATPASPVTPNVAISSVASPQVQSPPLSQPSQPSAVPFDSLPVDTASSPVLPTEPQHNSSEPSAAASSSSSDATSPVASAASSASASGVDASSISAAPAPDAEPPQTTVNKRVWIVEESIRWLGTLWLILLLLRLYIL
jgi:ubiquitin-conjugating enzyme E2 J1